MPYRSQAEKGIRREWSRRYGYQGFPAAGGMRKQGSRVSGLPSQAEHLENIRYDYPDKVCRGGQSRLYADGSAMQSGGTGCILGIFEVAGATGIWIEGEDLGANPTTLRYDPDVGSPQVSQLIAAHLQDPSLDPSLPRHTFVADEANRRLYAYGATAQDGSPGGLFEIVMPEDGQSIANTKIKLLLPSVAGLTGAKTGLPTFSSAVVVSEMAAAAPTGLGTTTPQLDDSNIRGVMYVGSVADGTVGDGKVRRYDGVTLTEDSPAFATGAFHRQIVFAFAETVWCAGPDYLRRRDAAGSWSSISMPVGLVSVFTPMGAAEYGDALYIIGTEDTFAASKAVILKLVSPSTLTISRRPDSGGTRPSHRGFDIVRANDGFLYFGWQGDVSPTQHAAIIGSYDGSAFIDDLYEFFFEGFNAIGRMAAAGSNVYATTTIGDTGTGVFQSVLLDYGNQVADLSAFIGPVSSPTPPADMVIF